MVTETLLQPLRFEEAERAFATRVPMTEERFAELGTAARAKAFAIAGIAQLDLVFDIWRAVGDAIEAGSTLQEFAAQIDALAERRGWKGLTPHRVDNIFRTALQTAYSAGRYEQMTDPEVLERRPYWQYDAVNDHRTRPTHAALDGKVFRYDHPFWRQWYPPNGYRCRCGVRTLSEAQLIREGLVPETEMPAWVTRPDGVPQPLLPDPGFSDPPEAFRDAPQPDLSKYPPELVEMWRRRQERGGNR